MATVFISAVISGYEDYRAAARRAAEALGCNVLMAEDLPGLPDSPQSACLQLVRGADVTLVVLGERYGYPQASGLSATHEEFREARDEGDVLAMVQEGVEPEERQHQLIREAESWEHGVMRRGFTDPDELRDVVTRYTTTCNVRPVARPTLTSSAVGRRRCSRTVVRLVVRRVCT